MAGWLMAIGAFSLCAWLIGSMAKAHHRNTRSVLEMSESLRKTMLREKEKCEEECRAKDRIIRELNEQHSFARQQFLDEAREREAINRQLRAEVDTLAARVRELTVEVEALRGQNRRG